MLKLHKQKKYTHINLCIQDYDDLTPEQVKSLRVVQLPSYYVWKRVGKEWVGFKYEHKHFNNMLKDINDLKKSEKGK